MTVIKMYVGTEIAYYRCNLDEATSPLQHWDEDSECWVSTQYQCADCRHRVDEMAELAEDHMQEFECDWEVITGLKPKFDGEHEDAKGWYESYGWHLSTEIAGDVCHTAVEYEWLDSEDDEYVIDLLMKEDVDLSGEEAATIVSRARSIRETAEEVSHLLEEASIAWHEVNYRSCITYLERCRQLEMEHGDCPASQSLREKLIDEEVSHLFRS